MRMPTRLAVVVPIVLVLIGATPSPSPSPQPTATPIKIELSEDTAADAPLAAEESEQSSPSAGPWTIEGLLPGMTLDECQRILGAPASVTTEDDGRTLARWEKRVPTSLLGGYVRKTGAYFDPKTGKAVQIIGKRLMDAQGNVVLENGAPMQSVPDKVKVSEVQELMYDKGGTEPVRTVGFQFFLDQPGTRFTVEYFTMKDPPSMLIMADPREE